MMDWSLELGAALDSGDAVRMRAALSRVPCEAMRQIVPILKRMAETSEQDGHLEEALFYCDRLVDAADTDSSGRDVHRYARVRLYMRLERYAEALEDARAVAAAAPEDTFAHRMVGEAHEGLGDTARALEAYRRALSCASDDALSAHVRTLDDKIRKAALLGSVLNTNAVQEPLVIDLPLPPKIRFDPALLENPSIPAGSDEFRIQGVASLLWRFSGQLSARNVLERLQDSLWCRAWDAALTTATGERLRFIGSELGVLALRALRVGAAHALCAERFPQDARIATGIVHKHFLAPWHALHGDTIQAWTETERRTSFEEFTAVIDITCAGGESGAIPECDVLVFPQIDHTLLGTGIMRAVRAYCSDGRAAPRVMPARATLYAMAVQWRYPVVPSGPPGEQTAFDLDAIGRLRWSAYPQSLELDRKFWTPLTAPAELGSLDFADFSERTWDLSLPVIADGRVDAVLVWFELDLTGSQTSDASISSAPESALHCLRPAVYYTDPISLLAGEALGLHVETHETRLHIRPSLRSMQPRSRRLPSWYVPMLGDAISNAAYCQALHRALVATPSRQTLDIGAGCGLISMFAARAGSERVIGCEQRPEMVEIGREVIAANDLTHKVTLVAKECRALIVPDDLPERADLTIFESFDCSLIGEGILHFLAYSREHLLTADARYLPAGARLRAMAVEYRIDQVLDVDANLLNPYRASPTFVNVDARTLDYRALSKPFDLFDFDFATADPTAQEMSIDVPAVSDGSVGAILFWFDLRLDADTVLSNAPDGDALHWNQGLQYLPEARVVDGQNLPLVARHDGSALRLQWRQDAMAPEAFSRMPRFDPRWLAASADLEEQMRTLLQHCEQNPDEFVKVAQIAQRMAVDPALYNLDPMIAQRFMSMFFTN